MLVSRRTDDVAKSLSDTSRLSGRLSNVASQAKFESPGVLSAEAE